jgi:leishmanolysin
MTPATRRALALLAAAFAPGLAYACGGDSTGPTTTSTAVPGGAITTHAGDGQTAYIGSLLPTTPQVLVRNASGQPAKSVPVTFAAHGGGGDGQVTTSVTTTDSTGVASPGGWRLGSAPGKDTLTATVQGLMPAVFVASALPSQFTIVVRFIGSTPAAPVQQAFNHAVAKWESAIVDSLGSVPLSIPAATCDTAQPAINETVQNMLVLVKIVSLSSTTLGESGPCILTTPGNLPALGVMELNSSALALLEQNDLLNDVVEHEFAHLLGFGTIWDLDSLVQDTTTQDPWFRGPLAQAAFRTAIPGYTDKVVPVEAGGGAGTALAHWRESVMTNELMTGYINLGGNPLSAVTIQQMADLGYVVNPAAADPWPTTSAGAVSGVSADVAALPGPGTASHTTPLAGPLVLVNRSGTIVGTRRRPGR